MLMECNITLMGNTVEMAGGWHLQPSPYTANKLNWLSNWSSLGQRLWPLFRCYDGKQPITPETPGNHDLNVKDEKHVDFSKVY